MPECPNCERVFTGATCKSCGWEAETVAPKARPPRQRCDCGAALLASGLCSATGGYPGTAGIWLDPPDCTIPRFACPHCRGPLDWAGGCERCHGCDTGRREDRTFPGDRYELDKGHWQRVDGPRRACTPAENAAGFAAIRAILAKAPLLQDPPRERRRER